MGRRPARSVAVAGPSDASVARMLRRVGSASATKTCSAIASISGGIKVVDQFAELLDPAAGVALVRGAAGVVRQLGESALDHAQPGAGFRGLEGELNVGTAWVVLGQPVDVPGVREDRRWLDPLQAEVHRGAVGPRQLRCATRTQVNRRLVAEPRAESFCTRERGPHRLRWMRELDGPFDAIRKCHVNLRSGLLVVVATCKLRLYSKTAETDRARTVRGPGRDARLSGKGGSGLTKLPEHVRPMVATLGQLPKDDANWSYEMKWDGVRGLAYIQDGRARFMSRNDIDETVSYPELHNLAEQLGETQALLDGEIVSF